jgi:hypothetical protein
MQVKASRAGTTVRPPIRHRSSRPRSLPCLRRDLAAHPSSWPAGPGLDPGVVPGHPRLPQAPRGEQPRSRPQEEGTTVIDVGERSGPPFVRGAGRTAAHS